MYCWTINSPTAETAALRTFNVFSLKVGPLILALGTLAVAPNVHAESLEAIQKI